MPVSRFFGYVDWMNDYHKTQDELISQEQKKFKQAKKADWSDEVKALKRRGLDNNNNTVKD